MLLEDINSNQIKRAFLKIKNEMSELTLRLEFLEKENLALKNKLETIKTNSKLSKPKIIELIGNKLSGKIHIPDCPYAKKIAIQNQEIFTNIEHALRQKYKKCSCISRI